MRSNWFFLIGIAMIVVGFFFPDILTSWGLPIRGLPFMVFLFLFGYLAAVNRRSGR